MHGGEHITRDTSLFNEISLSANDTSSLQLSHDLHFALLCLRPTATSYIYQRNNSSQQSTNRKIKKKKEQINKDNEIHHLINVRFHQQLLEHPHASLFSADT